MFSYIIFVYMLSTIVQFEHKNVLYVVHNLEIILAIYFTAEFMIRMWAVDADRRYQGVKGKLKF